MSAKNYRLLIYNPDGKEIQKIECRNFHIVHDAGLDGRLSYVYALEAGRFDPDMWIMNYRYRPIAEKLVEKFRELRHINVKKILFIEDTEWEPTATAKRPWKARISKANKQLEAMTGYEYVLETRKHYTGNMQDAQLVALIYHELRHIDVDGNLNKHDIEDWGNIVATLGVDWSTTIAQIPNILDHEFDGWREMPGRTQQLSLLAK